MRVFEDRLSSTDQRGAFRRTLQNRMAQAFDEDVSVRSRSFGEIIFIPAALDRHMRETTSMLGGAAARHSLFGAAAVAAEEEEADGKGSDGKVATKFWGQEHVTYVERSVGEMQAELRGMATEKIAIELGRKHVHFTAQLPACFTLFDQAVLHLGRLLRVLSRPEGHMLLIGARWTG